MFLFKKKTVRPATAAEVLFEHLYRMGANSTIDSEGLEYVKSYDSFWYPMIRVAESKKALAEVMKGLQLIYDTYPDIVLGWDDPINDSLRYKCMAKLLGVNSDGMEVTIDEL